MVVSNGRITTRSSEATVFANPSRRLGFEANAAQIATLTGMPYGAASANHILGLSAGETVTIGEALQRLIFEIEMNLTEGAVNAKGEATLNNVAVRTINNRKVLELLGWALKKGPFANFAAGADAVHVDGVGSDGDNAAKAAAVADLVSNVTSPNADGNEPTFEMWGVDEITLSIGKITFNPRDASNAALAHQDSVAGVKTVSDVVSAITSQAVSSTQFDADLSSSPFEFKVFYNNGDNATGSENFDLQIQEAALVYASHFATNNIRFRDFTAMPYRAHLPAAFGSDNVTVFERTPSSSNIKIDLFGHQATAVRGTEYAGHEDAAIASLAIDAATLIYSGDAASGTLLKRVRRDDNISTLLLNLANNSKSGKNHRITFKVVDADADMTAGVADALSSGVLDIGSIPSAMDGDELEEECEINVVESYLHASIQLPLAKNLFFDTYVEIDFSQEVGGQYHFVSNTITIDTATKGVLPPMPIVMSCHAASGVYMADYNYPAIVDSSASATALKSGLRTVNEYMKEYAEATLLGSGANGNLYRGIYQAEGGYGRGGFSGIGGLYTTAEPAPSVGSNSYNADSGNAYLLLTKSVDLVSIDPAQIRISTDQSTGGGYFGAMPNALRPLKVMGPTSTNGDYNIDLPVGFTEDMWKLKASGSEQEGWSPTAESGWADYHAGTAPQSVAFQEYLLLGQHNGGYSPSGANLGTLPYLYFHPTAASARNWLDNVVLRDGAEGRTSNLRKGEGEAGYLTFQEAMTAFSDNLRLLAWANSDPSDISTVLADQISARKVRYAALLNAGSTPSYETLTAANGEQTDSPLERAELQKGDRVRVEYKTPEGSPQAGRTDVFDNLLAVQMSDTNPVAAVFDTTNEIMLVEFSCKYVEGNQSGVPGQGTILSKTDIATIVVAWVVELQYSSTGPGGYATYNAQIEATDSEAILATVPIAATLTGASADTANTIAARWNIPDFFAAVAAQLHTAESQWTEEQLIDTLKTAFSNNGNGGWRVTARPIVNQSFALSHAAANGVSESISYGFNALTGQSSATVPQAQTDAFVCTIGNIGIGDVDVRVPAAMSTNEVVLRYYDMAYPDILLNDKVYVRPPKPKATQNGLEEIHPIMVEYQVAVATIADDGNVSISHSTDNGGNLLDWVIYDSTNSANLTAAQITQLDSFPGLEDGSGPHLKSQDDQGEYSYMIPVAGPLSSTSGAAEHFAAHLLESKVGGLQLTSDMILQIRSRAYNLVAGTQATDPHSLVEGSQVSSKLFRVFSPADDNNLPTVNSSLFNITGNTIGGVTVENLLMAVDAYSPGQKRVLAKKMVINGAVNAMIMDAISLAILSVDAASIAPFDALAALFAAGGARENELGSFDDEITGLAVEDGFTYEVVDTEITTDYSNLPAGEGFHRNMDIRTRANFNLFDTFEEAEASASDVVTGAGADQVSNVGAAYTLVDSSTLPFAANIGYDNIDYRGALRDGVIAIAGSDEANTALIGDGANGKAAAILSVFDYVATDYNFNYVLAQSGDVVSLSVEQQESYATLPIAGLRISNRMTYGLLLNAPANNAKNATLVPQTDGDQNMLISLPDLGAIGAADDTLVSMASALNAAARKAGDGDAVAASQLYADDAAAATALKGRLQRQVAVRYANKPKLNQVAPLGNTEPADRTVAALAALTARNSVTVQLNGAPVSHQFSQPIAPVCWAAQDSSAGIWGISETINDAKADFKILGTTSLEEDSIVPFRALGAADDGTPELGTECLFVPTGIADDTGLYGLPFDAFVDTTMNVNYTNDENFMSVAALTNGGVPYATKQVALPLVGSVIEELGARKGNDASVGIATLAPSANKEEFAMTLNQRGRSSSMGVSVIGGHRGSSTYFAVDTDVVGSPNANGYVAIDASSYFVYSAPSRFNRGILELATLVVGAGVSQKNTKAFSALPWTGPAKSSLANAGSQVHLAAFMSLSSIDGTSVIQKEGVYNPDGSLPANPNFFRPANP